MRALAVDQALYGYDRGHRLIASSRAIDGDAARILRSVTDMAFDGRSHEYLTILPIPDLGCQAFIRTRPAGPSLRPGSVWSHVVLVSFADLEKIERLEILAGAFNPPDSKVEHVTAVLRSRYSQQLVVESAGARPRSSIEPKLARKIVAATYSEHGSAEVAVPNPEETEPILFAMLEQQWPLLRRSFAVRTRYRGSPSGVATFDVEVVERSSTRTSSVTPLDAPWVDAVVTDLLKPSLKVRRQLREFGPDGRDGRSDLPRLMQLLMDVRRRADAATVVDELCEAFPTPAYMARLKLSLLGMPRGPDTELERWPTEDSHRLSLLLTADPRALDYELLGVHDRLVDAWEHAKLDLTEPLSRARWSELNKSQAGALTDAMISAAPDYQVAAVSKRNRSLGLVLLEARPTALSDPDLWTGDVWDDGHLLDVAASAPGDVRRSIFLGLLTAGAERPAAAVCAVEPGLWWTGVEAIEAGSRHEVLASRSRILRSVLLEVGVGSVGSWGISGQRSEQLIVLLLAADPTMGLWRQVKHELWVTLAETPPSSDGSVRPSEWAQLEMRILTVGLLAGIASHDPALRKRAWRATFGELHSLLAEGKVDETSWSALAAVLPDASRSDRCQRLRSGAVDEIVAGRWPADETDRLLQLAGSHSAEMRDRIERMRESRNWFSDIFRIFR